MHRFLVRQPFYRTSIPTDHISTTGNGIRQNLPFTHPDNTSGIEYKYKQQLINAYDNSIRYTDGFLADIIQLLNENQAESALLYSPDHGEDLLDDCRKKFLHASPIPTIYQIHIPFFLWFSESYKTLKPETLHPSPCTCRCSGLYKCHFPHITGFGRHPHGLLQTGLIFSQSGIQTPSPHVPERPRQARQLLPRRNEKARQGLHSKNEAKP